jgi:organic hydroperoxide reductase OsmC/OhrA
MMGTLARFLAGKQIDTPAENFWADVQGDIEDVDGVLRITQIRVDYQLKVPKGKREDAKEVLGMYLMRCPAATSVMGCIKIIDNAVIEELG